MIAMGSREREGAMELKLTIGNSDITDPTKKVMFNKLSTSHIIL